MINIAIKKELVKNLVRGDIIGGNERNAHQEVNDLVLGDAVLQKSSDRFGRAEVGRQFALNILLCDSISPVPGFFINFVDEALSDFNASRGRGGIEQDLERLGCVSNENFHNSAVVDNELLKFRDDSGNRSLSGFESLGLTEGNAVDCRNDKATVTDDIHVGVEIVSELDLSGEAAIQEVPQESCLGARNIIRQFA